SGVSLLLRLFPQRGVEETGSDSVLRDPAVAHHVRSPDVTFVVEAEEHPSGQRSLPLDRASSRGTNRQACQRSVTPSWALLVRWEVPTSPRLMVRADPAHPKQEQSLD